MDRTATLEHNPTERATVLTMGDRRDAVPEPDGMDGVLRTVLLLLGAGYTVTVRRVR